MKVVHVNSSDRRGGAALAVYRLHQGLRAVGIDSRLLVQESEANDDPDISSLPHVPDAAAQQRQEAIWQVYRDRNRTSISNTHFSISLRGPNLADHPAVRAADVIHLHWVAATLTPASIRRLLELNKPIVWTLHDLAPFTGGCHFPAGCRRFQESCSACPQLRSDPFGLPAAVLRDKTDLWPAAVFTLVAPSRWMAEQAASSTVFRSSPYPEVIPNGVDSNVFRPIASEEARKTLGIPPGGTYILCGADQSQEKRKGFASLGRILDACSQDVRFDSAAVSILCLGKASAAWRGAPWPMIPLGRIAEEERIALAYAAADLFVLPSLEDNLPNMVLESLACGRPVVSFDVGGVSEIVRDGWNGRVVPPGDEAALAEAILSLAADAELRAALGRSGRTLIEERFSNAHQARAHCALYERLLNEARTRERIPVWNQSSVESGPSVAALLPALTSHCLQEQWQTAERECAARGQVIEEMQARLRYFESECAARLNVIEVLNAEVNRLRASQEKSATSDRPPRLAWFQRCLNAMVRPFRGKRAS